MIGLRKCWDFHKIKGDNVHIGKGQTERSTERCDRKNMNVSKNILYYLEQVLIGPKYSETATLLSTPVKM